MKKSDGSGASCPPISRTKHARRAGSSRHLLKTLFTAVLAVCSLTALALDFPKKTSQLAWFYKPPRDGNLDLLARKFHWFILTRNDESVRDELKARGVASSFLQYLRFDAIDHAGSCTARPHGNQVAYRPGDTCEILQSHPDWFLLDRKGLKIQYDHYLLMDPGNRGWREFWLARAREMQRRYNWDGVFLDNAEASFSKRRKHGMPAAYRNEAEFTAAVEEFLAHIYRTYFQPEGRPLFANIVEVQDSDVWFRYVAHLDGAMMESFAVDWRDGYREVPDWEEQLRVVERTQELGKYAILVAQGKFDDLKRQKFAYASYLLVTDGRAAFRYASADAYNQCWFYENYRIQLGRPLGPRYRKLHFWQRDFEAGVVKVDPARHIAEIQEH